MKILIISDIHGSLYYVKEIPNILKREQADKLILLGDLYYHGPRNPLPKEYNPMEVCKILNTYKDKLQVIRGNCDALVDEMISDFAFLDHSILKINSHIIYFTHGHKYNKDHLPKEKIDILVYGHFHTGFIKEENHIIFANPGSLSLPKDNTKHSYLILKEDKLILKDIDGKIIQEKDI